MKKIISLGTVILLFLLASGGAVYAHHATYSVEQIGENTVKIVVKAEADKGKGIQITSASKRGGKVLNIFYRVEEGTESTDSMDIDLRTMLPPIRIILTNISSPEQVLFRDIKDSYAEEYIRHLHDMGAVNGFPDGTFKPGKGVSRAEFVTMLLNAVGAENKPSGETVFKDTSNHWAKANIATAYNMKLINGFKDGTFRPNARITAAEASVVIDRLFKFSTSSQKDLPKLDRKHWAYNSIARIIKAGIISNDDKLFAGFKEDAYLCRADCAMMLSRAITTK